MPQYSISIFTGLNLSNFQKSENTSQSGLSHEFVRARTSPRRPRLNPIKPIPVEFPMRVKFSPMTRKIQTIDKKIAVSRSINEVATLTPSFHTVRGRI
jgi:hypothetical protein